MASSPFPACESALRLRLAEVDGGITPGPVETPRPPADSLQLRGRTFAEIERDVYSWSLRENGGSRRRAAKALSIARSTFCEKVKKLGLG